MRHKSREIRRLVDDLLAEFDARLRRPLNDLSSFFEWLRCVRFGSEAAERAIIKELRATLPTFERSFLYGETDMAALRAAIATLRRQIIELANKAPEQQ